MRDPVELDRMPKCMCDHPAATHETRGWDETKAPCQVRDAFGRLCKCTDYCTNPVAYLARIPA